jgi:hypothetical protein
MSQLSLTQSQQQVPQSSREDKIHGYLLIILEVVKFSCLEFEQQIEKYLSTYNLYHQQLQSSQNNTMQSTTTASAANSSNLTSMTNINLIENTARTCEELHSSNMLKLLPHGCFDPLHSNDPFMFLFKREKINVNQESATCMRLVYEKYDRIVKACLSVIQILNLANANQTLSSSMSASTSSFASSFTSPPPASATSSSQSV